MITFSRLGQKGNLGNQLFQIASTIGIAKKAGQQHCFPDWDYEDYFEFNFSKMQSTSTWNLMQETKFNYYEWSAENGDIDLNGWLQSERYFSNVKIKNVFKFKFDFENKLLEKYKILFTRKTILISVRRGDFVNNPNYFQLSYKYYLTALLHHFGNLESYNIIFASDSLSYCKKHFSFLPNVFFLDNLKPIEQLCLGSKCDNYIISNSTFSWWIAWLGQGFQTKIIRPVAIFRGEYSKKYDESDYFPSTWVQHDENNFHLPNTYFRVKIYGYFYEMIEKIIFNIKNEKKLFKKKLKKIIKF